MNYDSLTPFLQSNNPVSSYKNLLYNIKKGFLEDGKICYIKKGITYGKNFNFGTKYKSDNEDNFKKVNNSKKRKKNGTILFIFESYDNLLHFIYDTLLTLIFFDDMLKMINTKIMLATRKVNYEKWITNLVNINKVLNHKIFEHEIKDINDIPKNVVFKNIIYFPKMFSNREIYNNKYNSLVNNIQNCVKNRKSQKKYHKHIYISRRQRENGTTKCNNKRRILNENEVSEFFKKKGFHEVWLEDYSFLEKIEILNYAKTIVVQSSATCIFLSMIKDKKIVILSGSYVLKVFPSSYNKYHKIIRYRGYYNREEHTNSPWTINISKLNKFWNKNRLENWVD